MSTTDASQIHDLRSALGFLREMPGQLLETDTQVDPDAEVSGVYRHVGAGGTVMRPTKEGPAMVFNNVKGFDDAKVCIGMLASRKRVAALLDLDEEHLGLEIGKRFENLIAPEQIAGALRSRAVELADCVTVPQKCIANAEYVLEGYLMHDEAINEDVNGHGCAMPEFPGYTGGAKVCPVIKITAVTTRINPIMESCIGPSHEHVSMAGIPTEASIYKMVETAIPGRLLNVHAAPCGGGKFVAIMQFKKSSKNDEGRQRNAAMLAFSAFSELKHVILVDEDVDIFDMSDVMWAMTTRFQADVDLITIPGCHCHVLDPSNDPAFDPSIREHGIACKAIFDCTAPFNLKKNFIRSQFMEIDKDKWAAELAF